MFYCIGRVHETSPGTHTLFPSYTHSINTKYSSVQLSDFGLFGNLIPAFSLKCSKPEFCLILSSDSTSRWTPLASAVSFPLPGGLGTFPPCFIGFFSFTASVTTLVNQFGQSISVKHSKIILFYIIIDQRFCVGNRSRITALL